MKFGTDTVKGYDGKADGCQQEGIVCEGLGTVSVCPVKKWYPQNNGEIPERGDSPSSQGPYVVKSGPDPAVSTVGCSGSSRTFPGDVFSQLADGKQGGKVNSRSDDGMKLFWREPYAPGPGRCWAG